MTRGSAFAAAHQVVLLVGVVLEQPLGAVAREADAQQRARRREDEQPGLHGTDVLYGEQSSSPTSCDVCKQWYRSDRWLAAYRVSREAPHARVVQQVIRTRRWSRESASACR